MRQFSLKNVSCNCQEKEMPQNCWKNNKLQSIRHRARSKNNTHVARQPRTAKHDNVCYRIQPTVDQIGWRLARTEDNVHVFKVIRLCLCRRYHDHSSVSGWRRGRQDHLTLVPTCCSCQSQPCQIQRPITGQMDTEVDLMGIPYVTETTI